MASDKGWLLAGLTVWALFAFLLVARTPAGAFTHDFQGHVQHTRILYNEHRLALPREGWETYQPPLYYGVNTLLTPNLPSHTFKVRVLSVLYGVIALLLMRRILQGCHVPALAQSAVLFFVATTPAFLFLFTSYNNDALATVFSMGVLVTAFEWIEEPGKRRMILLGALATAGLYTKLNVAYPITALVICLTVLGITGRLTWGRIGRLVGVLAIGVFLLIPWLIGHNYRLTGQWTPVPADFPLYKEIRLPQSPRRTLVTPPGWTPGEWKDPFAHVWEEGNNKKSSYLAYVLDTSIFGEYTFEFLPPIIPWSILLIHACLWLAALFGARRSPYGLFSLAMIGLGILSLPTLFFRAPYAGLMDFRYIAWAWLPAAVLYGVVLASPSRTKVFPSSDACRAFLFIGAFLQSLVWLALLLGGRWNFPW